MVFIKKMKKLKFYRSTLLLYQTHNNFSKVSFLMFWIWNFVSLAILVLNNFKSDPGCKYVSKLWTSKRDPLSVLSFYLQDFRIISAYNLFETATWPQLLAILLLIFSFLVFLLKNLPKDPTEATKGSLFCSKIFQRVLESSSFIFSFILVLCFRIICVKRSTVLQEADNETKTQNLGQSYDNLEDTGSILVSKTIYHSLISEEIELFSFGYFMVSLLSIFLLLISFLYVFIGYEVESFIINESSCLSGRRGLKLHKYYSGVSCIVYLIAKIWSNLNESGILIIWIILSSGYLLYYQKNLEMSFSTFYQNLISTKVIFFIYLSFFDIFALFVKFIYLFIKC